MRKIYFFIPFLLLWPGSHIIAQIAPLTVEKIMRDPKWMGSSPTNYRWSIDSKQLYFDWNPKGEDKTQVYSLDPQTGRYALSSDSLAKLNSLSSLHYNQDRSIGAYEEDGDLFIKNFHST